MFYAVKAGRTPGIYKTWAECENQVKGFSGAKFKKFDNEKDALNFIGQDFNLLPVTPFATTTSKNFSDEDKKAFYQSLNSDFYYAFVDGSYNINTQCCGAGAIVVHNNIPQSIAEFLSDAPNTSMRNVYGEIRAAEMAIEWALEQGASDLIIYHDYEGIAKWCTGEWKTKKERTEAYKEFYNKASKFLNITFSHVRGHTGNIGNEEADMVAKRICGVEE